MNKTFLISATATMSLAIAEKQKNVLFIAVDDLRTELGCYGVREIKTPNLDRLAKSSVTFSNHFVQVPTCGVSRAALLTGRRPSESGGMGNHALTSGKSKLSQKLSDKGAQTLPEMFKRSGYHTVCIGKISHMPDGKVFKYNGKGDGRAELPNAWSELATPYGAWKYGHGCFFAYANGKHREDKSGYRPLMEFPNVADNELPDGMIADAAVKKLKEVKDKPFFLAVGFYKPHLPFVAPKKYRDLYNQVDVKIAPVQDKNASKYWHGSGEFGQYHTDFKKLKPLLKKDQVACKKAYYACVSYVDAQIGKVLDQLEALGLAENTVVVLWGDHGWHLGDHAIWGKHSPLNRAVCSPLMIRDPELKHSGMTEAVVETVDILPTLLDLCQPKFTQSCYPLGGVSLKPILKNSQHPGKNASISYWGRARSVKSGNYRLIGTKGKEGYSKLELYNHKNDPDEAKNIATSNPEITARLLKLLEVDKPQLIKE